MCFTAAKTLNSPNTSELKKHPPLKSSLYKWIHEYIKMSRQLLYLQYTFILFIHLHLYSKTCNVFPQEVFRFQQKALSVSSKTKWQPAFSLRDKDQSLGKFQQWTLKISLVYMLAWLIDSTTFCRSTHVYLGHTPSWSEPELTSDLRSHFRYFSFRGVNWQNLKEEKKKYTLLHRDY